MIPETSQDDTLAAAIAYQSDGLSVIPIKAESKESLVAWRRFQDERADETMIRDWFAQFPDAGVGIVTGAISGLVVIDIDNRNGGDVSGRELFGTAPETVTVLTPGGEHWWFQANGEAIRNSAGLLGDGIDVRGDGGYVLAPPSRHPSGAVYQWEVGRALGEIEIAPLPLEIAKRITAPAKPEPVTPSAVAPIREGQRNHTLTRLAGAMRRRGASAAATIAALDVENRERCSPPLTAGEIKAIAASVARYAPEAEAEPKVFKPLDWSIGDVEIVMVVEPWIPRAARVLLVGATESAKSMIATSWAVSLGERGARAIVVSEENPEIEDRRRLRRLGADRDHLTFFNGSAVDLADPEWVDALIRFAQGWGGVELIVVDTLTAAWSGDDLSNREIADFDREVWQPIIRATGAAVVVVDHTGHQQFGVRREGNAAARGASSKAQKSDVVLVMRKSADGFEIAHHKARLGGRKADPVIARVIDREDGTLAVEYAPLGSGDTADAQARERALRAVSDAPGTMTKTKLAAMLGMRKDEGLRVVSDLLAEGLIGPDEPRARLSLIVPEP